MSETQQRGISVFTMPLLLIIIAILLFIALLKRENELAVAAALILGVSGSAKVWSMFSLRKLPVDAFWDKKNLFPGEAAQFSITVDNRKFLPVLVTGEIAALPEGLDVSEPSGLYRKAGLLWYQKTQLTWSIHAVRRGIYRVGPITQTGGDFLGFFRKERAIGSRELTVYPRIYPIQEMNLSRMDLFGAAGKKSPVLDPVYVRGTREYQNRQPARYIHWKASARHNRLMEKMFDPSQQEKILIAVDASGFRPQEKAETFERCLEGAASLAAYLDTKGIACGMITNGTVGKKGKQIIQPGRERSRIMAILETMAGMEPDPAVSLENILTRGLNLSWGISCVLFTCTVMDYAAQALPFTRRGMKVQGVIAEPENASAGGTSGLLLTVNQLLGNEELPL